MPVENEEYPSNTMRNRDLERKKPNVPIKRPDPQPVPEKKDLSDAPVVKTRVKKPSLMQRLSNSFVSDGAQNVGEYVFWDVLIPAAKDTIRDIITQGIEMWLFGTSGKSRSSRGRTGPIVQYGNYYRGSRDIERESRSSSPRARTSFHSRLSGVMFDYEEDAGMVLDYMFDILEQYGSVSVADFYETAGLPTESDYTDNSWGWTNLSRAQIVRRRDGYVIAFTEPERIA